MPIQTAYSSTIAPSYEGMIANSEPHTVVSKLVESAAGIGFGKVVVQGAADDQVRVSEASRAFVGLSEASHNPEASPTADLYPQYANVPVMRKGVMWVMASVAVSPGQAVYYVPASGVLTNVSNTGANTLIPNAVWDSSTTGAGLAKVRLGAN
jgi:plastocyanin